jgi:hypothetical protein
MKKNIFDTILSTTIKRLLRRTLVRSVLYSAIRTAKTPGHQLSIRNLFVLLCVLCASVVQSNAQTWIWYPGDYEIWLANQMENRRTDRGTFFPVFWKVDSHYPLMDFHKTLDLRRNQKKMSIYGRGTIQRESLMENHSRNTS